MPKEEVFEVAVERHRESVGLSTGVDNGMEAPLAGESLFAASPTPVNDIRLPLNGLAAAKGSNEPNSGVTPIFIRRNKDKLPQRPTDLRTDNVCISRI